MSSKKKVAIIGTVGLPANYGGFETMVKYLTEQKSKDFEFTVFCQKTPKEKRIKEYNGSKLIYLPFFANGLQSIIYDIVAMAISWRKFDALVILGTPGCIVLPFFKIFRKTKTIINFGGLEWARDKWGSLGKKYLKLTERVAVKNATIMVADNQHFCNYIKETYGVGSVLIEYGGNHTKSLPVTAELKAKYPFLNLDYDVSVSRAQVDNNLHLLLETYSKIPKRNLVLISNYNSFEYGKQLKEKYTGFPNLFLQDAVYNIAELDVIRSNAQLYIHSHSFCGTAPSLVEAMNLNLPVIAFDVPTNHFTTEDKALYFKNEEELFDLLQNINQEKLSELAKKMRDIASRRYSWEMISQKYADLF
jgi:glycosyltransferase involved in cell wall biosynthesis